MSEAWDKEVMQSTNTEKARVNNRLFNFFNHLA
jgi:hypothetical protein